MISNCSVCLSNSSLDTVCQTCANGFYLSSATSCSACPIYCLTCTSPSACVLCKPTFVNINGSCECNNSLSFFFSNTSGTCVACHLLVVNCVTCNNVSLTAYACVDCIAGMYPSLPTLCSPCSVRCASCSNLTFCLSCPAQFLPTPVAGECLCDSSSNLFLNTSQTGCDFCYNIVAHCQTCSQATVCTDCDTGYYLASPTTCLPCSLPDCLDCSSAAVCTLCNSTFTLANASCSCNTSMGMFRTTANQCESCISLDSHCDTCIYSSRPTGVSCSDCVDDYFPLGGVCTPCILGCSSCNSTSNCIVCHSPTFVLNNSTLQCNCNAALKYIYNGTACELCTLSHCSICSNLTACSLCDSGFYLSNSTLTCLPIVCGDGVISAGEGCDDSNTANGDGCNSSCAVEPSYACYGEPSNCSFALFLNITLREMVMELGTCNKLVMAFSL